MPNAFLARPAVLAGCLLACGVGGCADALKQPYPAKAYYGLDPLLPPPGTTSTLAQTVVAVRQIRVAPPYDGLAFVYQTGPERFETDYYVNWVAAPSALLTNATITWLNTAAVAKAVGDDADVHVDSVLDGSVSRLVIDRTDPARPKARIDAHFFLTRQDTAAVVFDRAYSAEVGTSTGGADAYAAAYKEALDQVLQRLDNDLRTVVPTK